jgi:mannose-6-phosphate isomerase-like protein (cupin superfamily)
VKAGEALSVQMHEVKDETLHLLSGEIELWAGPSPDAMVKVGLAPGQSCRVRPRTVHRIVAVTDADVLEASTPHLEDVVRFNDRYGRAPAGP